ncbi:DUF4302 domain-containing protein [Capnocytophaga cynodegmi]|uniref:DUF4302 domain-containing protein n=1 Tax=Capnocytophaga cynodegmi TaxID=28189 RepID=UPI00385E5753
MKKYLILLAIVGLFSCKKEYDGISPSQRNLQNINELRKELTEAPYGWKVMYFSKTDSLAFSNKDEVLKKEIFYYRDQYGYGGHYFLMKFTPEGKVTMLADFDANSSSKPQESQFEIKQNTFTELSFTTYNYIHQLVNEQLEGKSDFLYLRKDFDQNLLFKTTNSIEPAREYIVFEKLKSEEAWKHPSENNVQKAYENRTFFAKMKNPQIVIRKGSRVFFQSDVVIKTTTGTPEYNRFLKSMIANRYYVFLAGKKWNANPNITVPDESYALGSGYVGTEQGITFRTGIRYDKDYIFYDFERKGDTFVCELVKVYDPIYKRYMFVSKHLYPDGEPTHFVAEIVDK